MTEDPAQTVFEPTGELFKDYCAYCEIEERDERDDVLDAITLCDVKDSPRNSGTPHNVHTKLFLRGLESPLYRRDMSALSNAIPHCRNLYSAKLFGCNLSSESWKSLVEAVTRSPSLITVAADFNGSGLGKDPTVTRQLKPVSIQTGKTPEHITKLPDGWHAILLTQIQEVSLRGNQITDKQVKPIAQLLESSKNLISLNLWGNCIRDEGAGYLAAALRSNQQLTALNLGDNRISDVGLLQLADSFVQADLPLDPLKELREKVVHYYPEMSPELPGYYTYSDIASGVEQREVKKPPPKGKGKDHSGGGPPVSPWDKSCVKLTSDTVRVPGNTTLWSLNASSNRDVTVEGVQKVIELFEPIIPPVPPTPEDPPIERKKSTNPVPDDTPITPASVVGTALTRFCLANPNLPKELSTSLDAVLAKHHQPPMTPTHEGVSP